MTVWVDDMRIAKYDQYWCHLVADTWEEMHGFAQKKLGLPASRFHAQARLPHYDITWEERHRAMALGASLISRRQLVRKSQVLLTQKHDGQ